MTQPFLYSVEREFAYPIADVWSAWTDAEKLESWYHPTDLTSVKGSTASDLRVGGLWACAVDVPAYGIKACFYGTYTDIVLHSRLEHTMHYTQSEDEFQVKDMTTPSHRILIEFEQRGESSWVKFSQFGELPEGQAERAQAGMESYFDSLGNFLSK